VNYKLVGVAGDIRGEVFELNDGSTSFGRASQNDHILDLAGISSQHFKVNVNDDFVGIEDLDSSNGTFVNKKLVKSQSIKTGDLIAVPHGIFKLVKIDYKIVEKQKELENSEVQEDLGKFAGFQKHVMPIFYKFNLSYEWKHLLFFFVTLTSLVSSIYAVNSLLSDSQGYVKSELSKRADVIVNEVVRANASKVYYQELDKINLNYLDNMSEVVSYQLLNTKGIIIAPVSLSNKYTDDTFSIEGMEALKSTHKGRTFQKMLGEGRLGVINAIYAQNLETQSRDIVGFVSITLEPNSLRDLLVNQKRYYLEVCIVTFLIALFFGSIIYFLTVNYLRSLTTQAREILEENRRSVDLKYLFSETKNLKNHISQMGFKLREFASEGGGDFEENDDEEKYLHILTEILKGYPGAGLVLKSDKSIYALNPDGEDVLGMRENLVTGEDLSDVVRDQSFVAKIMTLAEQSSDLEGAHVNEVVEIGGSDYLIGLSSLIGRDKFPKGFLVSFYKES